MTPASNGQEDFRRATVDQDRSFRRAIAGADCIVCGVPIGEDGPIWVVVWLDRIPAHAELSVIGSMDCFVRWSTELAAHYVEHLADGE